MGLKLELAVGKVLISKICMLTISENFLSYETEIKFIPFKDCDSNDYITSKSNNNIISYLWYLYPPLVPPRNLLPHSQITVLVGA